MPNAQTTSAPTLDQLYGALFQHSVDAVYLTGADGTILDANGAACRLHGMTLDEIKQAGRAGLVVTDDRHAAALEARARAGSVRAEMTVRRKDGTTVPVEVHSVLLDPARPDSAAFVISRDISARKRADDELRASLARSQRTEQELRHVVEKYERQVRLFEGVAATTPDFVYLFDLQGRFLYANRRLLDVWGMQLPDVVGKTCRELGYEPWHHDMHMREIAQVIETKRPIKGEVPFQAPRTGTFGIYEYIFTPVLGPDGEVEIVAGTTRDVTDRKRGEEALRATEQKFRSVLENLSEGLVLFDGDGNTVYQNPASLRIHGVAASEGQFAYRDLSVTWRGWDEHGRPLPFDAWPISRVLRGEAFQDQVLHAERVETGHAFDASYNGCPIRDDQGTLVHGFITMRDITEHKRMQQALQQSEQQLRVATLAAEIGVWSWIPGTSEVSVTANWRRLFGVAPDARVTFETWREALHPDDRERAVGELNDAAAEHREFDTEYRVVQPDGSVRWIVDRGRASYDADGRPIIMGGVNIDITRRKRAEEALRDADRRKDEFLGMLSHELRNPLAPIRNSTYILQHAAPGSEQARRAQAVIQRQTEHLTRLVDDLLDVTRIARGKIELRRAPIDLRDVVSRAGDDFRLLMRDRGVRFDAVVPDDQLWADADATRITQVVGNLLHNAAKFTRHGDEVVLTLVERDGGAAIVVRDTGAGIDPELLPRVFDAFVQGERTLARTDGGLGLGLALVKGITELHGGTVGVKSAGKGKGAEFVVRLPLLASSGAESRPAQRPDRGNGGRRVLVVDDNTDAAESLAEVVRILGHAVEVAHDGPSAVEKARANPPDAVLCDLGLPGMSGYEVARALRAAGVDSLQLIAVSGYAQPEDVRRAIEAGFDGHLAKPCDPERIERLLG